MYRLLLTVVVVAATAAAAAPSRAQSTGQPWQIVPAPQSSLVYARDGELVGEIGREWRTSIALRSLPRYVPQAFVAVEDQRFYEHDGVDLIGVASAIRGKLLGQITGEHRGGASTITQQLVGNMHPDQVDRRDPGLARKLREQQAAREMERHYSKEQILEAYLNQINFGRGWYGIEAAARHYFGKSAAHLSLSEAATLAALPKSPVGYDPARHPDRARQRRDLILGLMQAQGYVSAAEAARARAAPVVTAPHDGMAAPAPWFVDAVRQAAERVGVNLLAGGYRVHTTLDPLLQRSAVRALADGIARVERRADFRGARRGGEGVLEGAIVALEPSTGDVRALVGGRDHARAPFNRATQALRQPGSSFKPFLYAKALEDGLSAATVVADSAVALPLPSGDVYRPDNADGQFLGPLTLREALVRSRNPVAVQLALRVGLDSIGAVARRAGVSTPIVPVPASALGASVVRPLDWVAAYALWDNLGSAVEPRLIARIEDASGRTVYQRPPSVPHPVVDPRVAFIVRDMMREAAERGTGTAARRLVPLSVPVAGKTGTTNDNADVWFVGMTPDLVAGVWLGFDRPRTIAPGAAGGSLAAPVWGEMMAAYYSAHPGERSWTPPVGLTTAEVDRITGQIADSNTPPERHYREYFVPGTEPEPLRWVPWKGGVFGALVP